MLTKQLKEVIFLWAVILLLIMSACFLWTQWTDYKFMAQMLGVENLEAKYDNEDKCWHGVPIFLSGCYIPSLLQQSVLCSVCQTKLVLSFRSYMLNNTVKTKTPNNKQTALCISKNLTSMELTIRQTMRQLYACVPRCVK